jgi:5-methylcytosine-specific restriction endonuclease McrA
MSSKDLSMNDGTIIMRIKWNKENTHKLIDMFESGESLDSISKVIGGTKKAIQVKLNRIRLGLKISRSITTKVCVGCGKKERTTFSKAKELKFCSKDCWDRNRPKGPRKNKKIIQTSSCLYCGNKIRKNGKYCNNKCLSSYKNSNFLKRWLGGEYDLARCGNGFLSTFARRYLLNEAGNKCTKCGWNEIHSITKKVPLTIDHIDGNSNNTNPNNLKVLCPNCHSLTSTYGALNKENGRVYRRRNYK